MPDQEQRVQAFHEHLNDLMAAPDPGPSHVGVAVRDRGLTLSELQALGEAAVQHHVGAGGEAGARAGKKGDSVCNLCRATHAAHGDGGNRALIDFWHRLFDVVPGATVNKYGPWADGINANALGREVLGQLPE